MILDDASLPEVLKAGGYHTYMVGKWHLGHDAKTSPYARGFEETFILVPGGGSHWNDRKPITPAHDQVMIYQRNGKPFFAYLAYTAPHDPLHAPREYIDKHKGKYDGGFGKGLERVSSRRAKRVCP